MRIGKRKVMAALGVLLIGALAFGSWVLWGTDGLLAATLVALLVTIMIVGWLVAQVERRVRRTQLSSVEEIKRLAGKLRSDSEKIREDSKQLAATMSGEHAENLLKAVQSGYMRAEHTLNSLAAEWLEAYERTSAKTLEAIEREFGVVGREVAVVGREVGAVSREMEIAATRVDGTVEKVEKTAQESQKALTNMRSAVKNIVEGQNDILYRQVEALASLYIDLRPRTGLPPTRFFSASPDLLRTLYHLVLERKPKLVVECGSGVSSIVMGYAMKENGIGKVVALEHLEAFKDLNTGFAEEHDVSDWVEVVHAPLQSVAIDGVDWMWYSTQDLPEGEIDMVVVDGPPSWVGDNARYPAAPLLRHQLAPDAILILDDYRRDDEIEIGERWLSENPGWSSSVIGHEKGTGVFGVSPPAGPATHVAVRHRD